MKKRPGKKNLDCRHYRPYDIDRAWNSCHDAHTEWLPSAEEINLMFEEYIKKWMLMDDCPSNRSLFPEDNWYGNTPTRVVVSLVGIDQLRKLAKAIRKRLE